MPTVFISHASADKPFVYRLVAELLGEGVPVWLDKWELGPGDPLIAGLDEALDESARVLVVVSKHATETKWVKHEVEKTLAAEIRLGRRLLLPVRIDDSEGLAHIADRIHIDFSDEGSFMEGVHAIIDHLRQTGLSANPDEAGRLVLPLSFHRGTELDTFVLERIFLRWIKAGGDRATIAAESIHLLKTREHNEIQRELRRRISTHMSEPDATAESLEYLRIVDADVVKRERDLRERSALVLRDFGYGFGLSNGHLTDVLRVYTRVAMHYLLYTLTAARSVDVKSTSAFATAIRALPGFEPTPDEAAWWKIHDPIEVYVRHRASQGRNYTTARIFLPKAALTASENELETYPGVPFREALGFEERVNFALPQMLHKASYDADSAPASWDEDNFHLYRRGN